MPDTVNWVQVAVTSAVTLSVPVVAHVVGGRKSKAVRVSGQLREVSETIKNLPDDHRMQATMSTIGDTLATQYARMVNEQVSLKRDTSAIALGVSMALVGANLGVYALVQQGGALWWLALAIPLFIMGLFGATYEASGGKNRRKPEGENKAGAGR